METFSALLAICAGNSPVNAKFPTQRPVMRSFDASLICAWINGLVNNREAGDLRRHRARYDITVVQARVVVQKWHPKLFTTGIRAHVWYDHIHVKQWDIITAPCLNPLRAKFFRGNINIYLHFMSLFHIDVAQKLKILSQVRPGLTYSTWSTSWLLMPWRR